MVVFRIKIFSYSFTKNSCKLYKNSAARIFQNSFIKYLIENLLHHFHVQTFLIFVERNSGNTAELWMKDPYRNMIKGRNVDWNVVICMDNSISVRVPQTNSLIVSRPAQIGKNIKFYCAAIFIFSVAPTILP